MEIALAERIGNVRRESYLAGGARRLPEYWGGWFSPIGDGHMKETNLNVFYHLGGSLTYLQEHIAIGMPVKALYGELVLPQSWLESFLRETKEFFSTLRDTRTSADRLLIAIKDIMESIPEDWERTMTTLELHTVFAGKDELEKNFEREHRNLNVFTVTPKGIYDTRLLVEQPELKFAEKIRPILPPQMLYDLKQAGRCLAFDIPTACAFHVCRGTEALMLTYYERLAGHSWCFAKKDWKIYIEQLRKEGAPKNITNRLDEIRELDRNTYIHPDVNVTLEEAPILFELCTGVAFLMGQEITKLIP